MQNMQNQQLDEFGNPIQQQPVQAPNPMMPNRAGAPPRSMNNLAHQPLSTQGSMAYQKGKLAGKSGIGSVGNKISGDALIEKIRADVEKEREKFVGTGGNNSPEGKLISGEPLKPGHPDYVPPKKPNKPKEMIGKYTVKDFPEEEPGFSNTKALSDSTRAKISAISRRICVLIRLSFSSNNW